MEGEKVVQQHDPSLSAPWLEDLERHRVATQLEVKSSSDHKVLEEVEQQQPACSDAEFSRLMKTLFVIVLSVNVIRILYELHVSGWLAQCSGFWTWCSYETLLHIGVKHSGVLLTVSILVMLVTVIKMKKMQTKSTLMLQMKEEVKTISGLIQQV
ncbi:uncharacterized protein KZ484_007874 isoform 1-T1 [Pholidichthys leucotaenia]